MAENLNGFHWLTGGFNLFIFSPLLGEMNQFDLRIFFRWVGSTTNQAGVKKSSSKKIIKKPLGYRWQEISGPSLGWKNPTSKFPFFGVFSHTTSWGATAFTVPTASHGTTHGGGTTRDAGRAKPGILCWPRTSGANEKKGHPKRLFKVYMDVSENSGTPKIIH